MRHEHPDFSVDLPPGWSELTRDPDDAAVENEDVEHKDDEDAIPPPVVFARDGGRGVLQVTVALHPPGERSLATGRDLRKVLDEYAAAHGFTGRPANPTTQDRPIAVAAGTYARGDVVDRAWCVSADGNVAFFSYTVATTDVDAVELAEADRIARSVEFGTVEEDGAE